MAVDIITLQEVLAFLSWKEGKERKGKERKGKERKGKERQGKARQGKERKGKEGSKEGRDGKKEEMERTVISD